MISYVLNKDITLEKIGKDINRLIETYKRENSNANDLILNISIVRVCQESVDHIPKLENKKDTVA